MKKFIIYTFLFAFVATISFTGCKETETGEEAVAYETLTTYLKSESMDLSYVIGNKDAGTFFAMAAPADGDLSAKWIMDIRGDADFNAGHITGAHQVAFSNILTAAATADKPILVVCKTGQTACYATTLLRLAGYPDTKALKWGMSGWNADLDKWSANCKDLTTETNWTTDATAAESFSAPSFSSSALDGASLLQERVAAVVAAGFKTASNADVLANPGNYYINNFFSASHYEGFGHVKGAVRVNPLSIDECDKLDPNGKVVTYCYTGQTSAIVTAYLNVLGFDAYSLLFGVNGMTTTNSFWETGGVTNHWGYDSNPKSLTYETN
ncbi:rhodanese-like domain-containing protein [Prolixibacteraceae bacterium Z1-6]|uniref:Rhodanese-like domain-containing protein n=1 Tax=Draconibacterium aestuarii TaxID=2998507 RepID=A0A9X3J6M0_9BACT|nr:rhodanese-like domain-containing protein [Prolixibacteraceae bacterium Z1-6]